MAPSATELGAQTGNVGAATAQQGFGGWLHSMFGGFGGARHQQHLGERTGFHDPHNVWGGLNMFGFNPLMGGRGGQRMTRMGPFPGAGGFGWGRGPISYDPSAFLNQGFGLMGHGAYHPGGFGGFGTEGRYNRYGQGLAPSGGPGSGLMAGGQPYDPYQNAASQPGRFQAPGQRVDMDNQGWSGSYAQGGPQRFTPGGFDTNPVVGGYRGIPGYGAGAGYGGVAGTPINPGYGGLMGGGYVPGEGLGTYQGYNPGGIGITASGTPTGPYGSNYGAASALVDNNASTVTNFSPTGGGATGARAGSVQRSFRR